MYSFIDTIQPHIVRVYRILYTAGSSESDQFSGNSVIGLKLL